MEITKAFYMILIALWLFLPGNRDPAGKILRFRTGTDQQHLAVTFIHIGLNIPSPTFLYSGFITGVPVELDEAALIDGASPERTFSIIFPLLKPGLP